MDATIPEETLIRLLPASCNDLLGRGIPLAGVLGLIRRYGGSPVTVPYTVNESSELAQILGLEALQKLVSQCAGDHFYVPRATRLERHCRDEAILRAYAEGHTLADIARTHQVTDRTVSTVVARHGKPNRLDRRGGSQATNQP
jgi:hypothetical protein